MQCVLLGSSIDCTLSRIRSLFWVSKMKLRSLLLLAFNFAFCLPVVAQTPCVFNPGNGRYQECLHVTAGGQCAHYGATCGGSGQPMYNPRTNATQECEHVTADGRCAHYGAPSGSSGQCMFNRATGAYQTCLSVTAGGQCAHFGAPCN